MRVSHKVDYGVRIMTTLAAQATMEPGRPMTSAALAASNDVPPGFIDDILQEIKASESDSVTFSVDLRRRCKIAGPILEHKMSTLQRVVIRQHRVSRIIFLQSCDAHLHCL